MTHFKIEKMEIIPSKTSYNHPDRERIKDTIKILNVGEGFNYPLAIDVNPSTVKNWLTAIQKEENNKIIDLKLRETNGLSMSSKIIKDSNKKPIALKIRRNR